MRDRRLFEVYESRFRPGPARKGLVVSLVVHACGALLMASGFTFHQERPAQFVGSRQVISLEATFAEPNNLAPAVEMAPVQIQPGVAWIAERRFVDRPTVRDDWELAIDLVEQTTNPTNSTRAVQSELPTDSAVLYEPVPRAQPISEPKLPTAPPEPVGVAASTPPRFVNARPARYPELARRRGWEGDVLLRLSIDETGKVTKVTVERSSGYEILDGAAVAAVRTWQAEPARRSGRPVKTIQLLPMQFRL